MTISLPVTARVLLLALITSAGACAASDDPSVAETEQPATGPSVSSGASSNRSTTTVTVDLFSLRPPTAAADAAALARQITDAETTLRDAITTSEAFALAALTQQVAYRKLGTHPTWDHEVASALPVHLRGIVERNAAARREFRAMHTKLPTALPAWEIVEPAAPDELRASYEAAEREFGIAWQYLAAINLVETGFGRIRGTSTAGAQGPMQFMPATWDAYGGGGDINDTHDAIMGAGRYLAANNGATDIDQALYRYNHSNHYVRGVRLYADLMDEHPHAFLAYYRWGIWYLTERGEVYLPVGYAERAPIPVDEYLARR